MVIKKHQSPEPVMTRTKNIVDSTFGKYIDFSCIPIREKLKFCDGTYLDQGLYFFNL